MPLPLNIDSNSAFDDVYAQVRRQLADNPNEPNLLFIQYAKLGNYVVWQEEAKAADEEACRTAFNRIQVAYSEIRRFSPIFDELVQNHSKQLAELNQGHDRAVVIIISAIKQEIHAAL